MCDYVFSMELKDACFHVSIMNVHLFDWKILEAISHINLVSLEKRSSNGFTTEEDFMHKLLDGALQYPVFKRISMIEPFIQ